MQHQLPAVRVHYLPQGNHLPHGHGHPRPLHHLALRRLRYEVFPARETRRCSGRRGLHGHLHGRAPIAGVRRGGKQREPPDHLPPPRDDAPLVLLRQGRRPAHRGPPDIRQEQAVQDHPLEGDAPLCLPRRPHHQRRHLTPHVAARPLGAHQAEALQAGTRPPPAGHLHVCQHRERLYVLRKPSERIHRRQLARKDLAVRVLSDHTSRRRGVHRDQHRDDVPPLLP